MRALKPHALFIYLIYLIYFDLKSMLIYTSVSVDSTVKRAVRAMLWLLCIAFGASVMAAPAVGIRIDNQAFAEYPSISGQGSIKIASNTVGVTVGQVSAFTLSASQTKPSSPGGQVVFAHTLTNTGNGSDQFNVLLRNEAGDFDFASMTVYADIDGNGVADNQTPLTQTPVLLRGQAFNFVVVALVPVGAQAGQIDQLSVLAAGAPAYAQSNGFLPAAQQINQDTVRVSYGPVIRVLKQFNTVQGPSPSENNIEVTLTYTNTGFIAAQNVLIQDIVPGGGLEFNTQGFVYVPNSALWNNLALTDAPGGDPTGILFSYETVGVYANTVRAFLNRIEPGKSGVLKFSLAVASGVPAGTQLTRNIAQAVYTDGALVTTVDSNPQSYSVNPRLTGFDLTLSKTAGALIVPNQCSVFTLNVRNIGDTASTGTVSVTDTLPAGLEYLPSCLINGVLVQSGGVSWTCPNSAVNGVVTCQTNHNYQALRQGANTTDGHPLLIVVRANAAQLNPLLPAVTANPNTVALVNRAVVSNDNEQATLRDNNTAQATLLVGPAATLRGRVWLDSNHDRQFQAMGADRALSGWGVEVLQNGVVVATASTADDGAYVVSGLVPAQYQVRFRDPANNILNGRPVCNERGLPSSPINCARTDISGALSAVSAQNDAVLVTLQAGDTASELSLPLDPSGVVYDSVTRQPIAGAVVTLIAPVGFDANTHLIGGNSNMSQTTGANGYYQYLLTPAGVAFCAGLATVPSGCALSLQVTPPASHLPPNSQIVPPPASINCTAYVNCLSATGLGDGFNVYAVQAQATAPALGQATPYFLRIVITAGDPDIVNNHIPLDPVLTANQNVLMTKTASRPSVETGEFVDYTVKVFNGAAQAVNGLQLLDQLPVGFKLVLGSVRYQNVSFVNPTDKGNGLLQWALPNIAPNTTVTLTYRVRIAAHALQGDGINTVTAYCQPPSSPSTLAATPSPAVAIGTVCSNRAQAKVQVLASVLNGKPIVIGKVFLDCNRDRVQSEREVGVPGVRIFSQDGTYAITDAEGKYSVYGMAARTHVLKIDPLSLPVDWEPVMLANRNAGDATSRFVDLSFGELHKANFADGACYPSTLREVHKRRELALNSSFEGAIAAGALWEKTLDFTTLSRIEDNRNKASSGSSDAKSSVEAPNAKFQTSVFDTLNAPSTASQSQDMSLRAKTLFAPPAEAVLLEKILEQSNNTLGFLNLKNGDTLSSMQARVQIKGMQGTTLALLINGQAVNDNRIGKRSVLESKQVQGVEYIGVALDAGKNTLLVRQIDPFGIVRGEQSITVMAPGPLASIEVSAISALKADSRASNKLLVLLKDAYGTPVSDRTPVTLVLSGLTANAQSPARIATPDQNPAENGTQVFASMGGVEIDFIAPDSPAQVKLTVEAGTVKQLFTLDFLPSLRSLVGVGVIDGAIRLNKLKTSDLNNNGRSGFDDELRCIGRPTVSLIGQAGQWDCLNKAFAGDKAQANLSTALYFKGEVKGEYLLTLAYDNAKDVRARVFRDFAPDEFYPIYGDAAERGFDANSSEKLYVRVDKGSSYVLYGDFSTHSNQPSSQLSQISRTMTGLKTQWKDDKTTVQTFITRDSLKQKALDIRANGTSGPFELGATGVINSEKVEVLVRDRNANSVVLFRALLQRFVDYEIETFTGRLLLRKPLASLDVDLNPVSLRVVFEQEDAAQAYWTAGVQAHTTLGTALELGGVAMKSFQSDKETSLLGAYITSPVGEKGRFTAEVARSQQDTPGTPSQGNAARLEYTYTDTEVTARVLAQTADAQFDNPSSSFNKNQTELSAKISVKVAPRTTVSGEAVRLDDQANQSLRQGLLFKAEHQLQSGIKLELGARHAQLKQAAQGINAAVSDDYTSLRAKLLVPILEKASVFIEAEQALQDADRQLLAIGGDYRLSNAGRVYARHEFANTLGSEFALSPSNRAYNTVVGLDAALLDNTQAFSEYRMKDTLSGRDAQAAIGLRQVWNVAQGLRLSASFERTHTLSRAAASTDAGASTAATAALQYTGAPDWKANIRLEWRDTQTQTSWLNTAGYAYKINQNWSALARHVLTTQHNHGLTVGKQNKYRTQLGVAYRDVDRDQWNALAKIEHRSETDTTGSLALKRSVSIASAHSHVQLNRQWWKSYSAAYKRVLDESNGLATRSTGALLAVRLNWDITHRWDAGLRLLASRAVDDAGSKQTRLGAGLEVGYMVAENTWLSAGYNLWGVKDRDLAVNEYTESGWYVRLRYKFDETLFNGAALLQGSPHGKRSVDTSPAERPSSD